MLQYFVPIYLVRNINACLDKAQTHNVYDYVQHTQYKDFITFLCFMQNNDFRENLTKHSL